MVQESANRGRSADLSMAHTHLAVIRFRQGALLDAEASARTSWEIARALGDGSAVSYWWSAASLTEVLIARGELEEAAELFDRAGLFEHQPAVLTYPWPMVLRGQLALAAGRTEEGVEILFETGAWLDRRGLTNPACFPWRPLIAPALAVLGRRGEARRAIAPALEHARRFGAPWALGTTLRAAGTVEQGERGLELLREAVQVLESSLCRLEHAHALLELGAMLRRRNERVAAREPLRAALEMAHRCGARPLVARAEGELGAAGARPRRIALSGVDSLTASERRVAELAARGLSNPEIAQQLFVTRKTVETHLGHIYSKLVIDSRRDLVSALDQA
jgi:ATP/maltotriose-dependent transcriptional regulator MalT